MPTYEYGCEGCGHRLEILQKLADAPLKTCPECGKDLLEKLISPTAFVLKGGGWYKDGYSGNDPKKPPRTENQRGDRVEKAIADDKKKTETAAPASGSTPAAPASSTPAGGDSGGSSGGSGGGSGGGGSSTGGGGPKTAASQ
ncbi:MAG: zinc ribbon domain-containing protein [Myxococcales bacterium]|nr:zinc ribbon domain-containing protein [Myxococcales bacterium]